MNFVDRAEKRGGLAQRVFLLIAVAIAGLLILGFFWATATPGEPYDGPAASPHDMALPGRLERHVRELSEGPRNLENQASIRRTLGYLEDELRKQGFDPRRQEVLSPADNLIVSIAAREPDAKVLIIGAHYDTAGASPGADDNASGVATLLELAARLKDLNGQSDVALELVFYANEEPPHFKTSAMGSFVHATSIRNPDKVLGMISLESLGYYSDQPGSQNYPFPLSLRYPDTGNFVAFVGDTSARSFLRASIAEFRKVAKIPAVGGTAPSLVQGIDWSDHWAYSRVGIPAFMVTDTAAFRNPHYHREGDTADTLDFRRMALVVEAMETVIRLSGTEPASENNEFTPP